MLAVIALAHAEQVRAVKVEAVPLQDPAAAAWQSAPETTLAMIPQTVAYPTNAKPTVSQVRVRALADGQWLAVRVEWADPSKDDVVLVDRFTDAVAVEIPLRDPAQTSPFMGNPGQPVYIAHWKAVWQKDVESGHADVQDAHPNYWADPYPYSTGTFPFPVEESFQGTDARRYFVATSAGNPVASLERRWPVEELHAEGFGSLADHASQDARAWGTWKDGTWSVVVAVPRRAQDVNNPRLSGTVPMAFAAWDGGAGNVGGRKHFFPFVDVVLP